MQAPNNSRYSHDNITSIYTMSKKQEKWKTSLYDYIYEQIKDLNQEKIDYTDAVDIGNDLADWIYSHPYPK